MFIMHPQVLEPRAYAFIAGKCGKYDFFLRARIQMFFFFLRKLKGNLTIFSVDWLVYVETRETYHTQCCIKCAHVNIMQTHSLCLHIQIARNFYRKIKRINVFKKKKCIKPTNKSIIHLPWNIIIRYYMLLRAIVKSKKYKTAIAKYVLWFYYMRSIIGIL